MPKHRKPKQSKPKKSTHPPKAEQPRRPLPGASPTGSEDAEYDDEREQIEAALAAYLGDLDEDERAAIMARIDELRRQLGDDFEIVGLDEEDLGDEELHDRLTASGAWEVPRLPSPAELMAQLVSAPEPPTPQELYGLSDLSREDAEAVRRQWELVPPDRRLYVIRELTALAEDDIDLALGRLLRIAMVDPDPETRRAAVRGLWNDDETDLIGPLIQMLRADPDVLVRAAAATGLGNYIYLGELDELDAALAMRVEEALLEIISQETEPLEVRRRALESIAFSGEAGVRQLIEDAYYSPDELMRISAIFAMGRSADIHWRSLVRAELQNPSAAVRLEAARACGELGAKSAAGDLSALLQDRDRDVRLETILALGRIGGGVAREVLETVLLSDDPVEVETAEYALEEMQFYDQLDAVSLFDEALDEDDEEWEVEAEDDEWYEDFAARDLGEYDESTGESDDDIDDTDDDLDDELDDDDDAWDDDDSDDDNAQSGPRRR